MYQVLLTRRYLFSKVMPLLASLGVMLCSAVVLVTWSVMGGFLVMLINTGRTMAGDVVVRWPGTGIPHYEDLIKRLEAEPGVEAAAPVVEAFGMISPPDGSTEGVVIRGVDSRFANVTRYSEIIWWRKPAAALPKDTERRDPRLGEISGTTWDELYEQGLKLERRDPRTGDLRPAVVPGIHVMGTSRRTREGFYWPRVTERRGSDGTREEINQFMPRDGSVTITVLPLDSKGQPLEPFSSVLPVANEFQSGVYDYDSRVVLVNLAEAQRMLRMQQAKRLARPGEAGVVEQPSGEGFAGQDSPPALVDDPARVTDVVVKGRGPMATSAEARALAGRVEAVYTKFAQDHAGQVPDVMDVSIMTWEDQNRTFISAVKNEISLLLVLFCFISITVVFLVIAIFWSMVREKTMDIGVLRAVGGRASGVAGLWLCYGLAIGLVGSSLGLGLAYTIVGNINPIHDWMGEQLGIVVWDPAVYYFSKIPNRVDAGHAAIVFAGGVVSCVVGALVPALRAAVMSPVRALRNE